MRCGPPLSAVRFVQGQLLRLSSGLFAYFFHGFTFHLHLRYGQAVLVLISACLLITNVTLTLTVCGEAVIKLCVS